MAQKILSIDDSEDVHLLLKARLKAEGYIFVTCVDPTQALDLIKEETPDLILLDVNMPEISGFELCSQLKANPENQHIPVIFLSATTDSVNKIQGLDLGAVDYVTKPFDPAELRARVRAALRTKRFHDLLAQRAQIDGLTGLWNRSHFDQRLTELVASAKRYGRPFSLVMVDVDHFKQFNDNYGHPFGDRVLQALGDLLLASARVSDVPCRYGGEEFGILLPETSANAAAGFCERIRVMIQEFSFKHSGKEIGFSASFGVAGTTAEGSLGSMTQTELLEAADSALYEAKENGRNQVRTAQFENGLETQ